MRRFPILALALMLGLPAAHAGMLPAYDAEVICSDLAGTSVKQEVVMRGCLDFQERMRNEVALAWDRLPVPVQEICGNAAQGIGDYWRLKSCIDREVSVAPSASAGR